MGAGARLAGGYFFAALGGGLPDAFGYGFDYARFGRGGAFGPARRLRLRVGQRADGVRPALRDPLRYDLRLTSAARSAWTKTKPKS